MISIILFIIFIFFVLISSQNIGGWNFLGGLGLGWFLAVAPGLTLASRTVFALLGGVFQGTLDQVSWALGSLAIWLPVMLIERIDKSLFIASPLLRRFSVGVIVALCWLALMFIGSVFKFLPVPSIDVIGGILVFFLIFAFGGYLAKRFFTT